MKPTRSESAFSEIQHPKKRAFLAAYAATGQKGLAARMVGIDRSALYQPGWRDDQVFKAALMRATMMAADTLEDEMHRRAVEGIEKPTGWYRGRPGGYVREFSDTLLIVLLKALRPEKYQRRTEVSGVLSGLDVRSLSDEQLSRLAAGEHPLSVLGDPGQVARGVQV